MVFGLLMEFYVGVAAVIDGPASLYCQSFIASVPFWSSFIRNFSLFGKQRTQRNEKNTTTSFVSIDSSFIAVRSVRASDTMGGNTFLIIFPPYCCMSQHWSPIEMFLWPFNAMGNNRMADTLPPHPERYEFRMPFSNLTAFNSFPICFNANHITEAHNHFRAMQLSLVNLWQGNICIWKRAETSWEIVLLRCMFGNLFTRQWCRSRCVLIDAKNSIYFSTFEF